jgi:Zn finger protein HypA/HybF involved in hydrogenase expression
MSATAETFRCMACGHEYQEEVEQGEDKERSCPKCRSNSIRHMKGEAAPAKGVPQSAQDPQVPRSHDDG